MDLYVVVVSSALLYQRIETLVITLDACSFFMCRNFHENAVWQFIWLMCTIMAKVL